MFTFKDSDLWKMHADLPHVQKPYDCRTMLWGHKYYGRDAIDACSVCELERQADVIWFEFILNLLSKCIHAYGFGYRPYANHMISYYFYDGVGNPLDKLFGKADQSYWPVILQLKWLVDIPADTTHARRFHEYSIHHMDGIVDEFLAFAKWVDEYAGKQRMQIIPLIREKVMQGGFGTELSDDPYTLSGRFMVTLKEKIH